MGQTALWRLMKPGSDVTEQAMATNGHFVLTSELRSSQDRRENGQPWTLFPRKGIPHCFQGPHPACKPSSYVPFPGLLAPPLSRCPCLPPQGHALFLTCLLSSPKVLAAIMTDGERREPFQPLASDEVRVPIASSTTPGQAPQPGEEKDEDALSACKSIQDSLASAGSSTRDAAPDGDSQVPYPALATTVFFCLDQTTRPRSWCLRLVCNPYPFPA